MQFGPLRQHGRDTIDKPAAGLQGRLRVTFRRLNAPGRQQVDEDVGAIVAQCCRHIDRLLLGLGDEACEVLGVAIQRRAAQHGRGIVDHDVAAPHKVIGRLIDRLLYAAPDLCP